MIDIIIGLFVLLLSIVAVLLVYAVSTIMSVDRYLSECCINKEKEDSYELSALTDQFRVRFWKKEKSISIHNVYSGYCYFPSGIICHIINIWPLDKLMNDLFYKFIVRVDKNYIKKEKRKTKKKGRSFRNTTTL